MFDWCEVLNCYTPNEFHVDETTSESEPCCDCCELDETRSESQDSGEPSTTRCWDHHWNLPGQAEDAADEAAALMRGAQWAVKEAVAQEALEMGEDAQAVESFARRLRPRLQEALELEEEAFEMEKLEMAAKRHRHN